MNYKNTYSTSSHEVNTYTSVSKTSGRKKRKKYRLAKNIIILFIVAAFSLGIGKGIALIFLKKVHRLSVLIKQHYIHVNLFLCCLLSIDPQKCLKKL